LVAIFFDLLPIISRFAASLNNETIISSAARTLDLQAEAIRSLKVSVNEDFAGIVRTIAACSGRLVISGIGKSAIISQKIVATFNSTGTPAIFMHAADAIHGDLGIVQKDDIVIIISKSGNSPEIKMLAPLVKNMGNMLIGMVGDVSSFLALQSDKILDTTVSQEACPNNLAPTTSTTAQMVMGDAVAICLMELKGFKTDDFARYHPGGALGKKLFLRVADLITMNAKPSVIPETGMKEVIIEITRNRLGTVAVVNKKNEIIGIITDGDIRRMMEKYPSIEGLKASDVMGVSPHSIASEALAAEALNIMRQNNISQLLVTDNGNYNGIIHLHDIIREGIL